MRKDDNQLRPVANIVAASAKLTDTSNNRGNSYHWRHMATVRREWQHEFRQQTTINPFELTSGEIVGIEARVRKQFCP